MFVHEHQVYQIPDLAVIKKELITVADKFTYLFKNLQFVVQSRVLRLQIAFHKEWPHFIQELRIKGEKEINKIEAFEEYTDVEIAWTFKKEAIFALMNVICALTENSLRSDKSQFGLIYNAYRTYVNICLMMRDLKETTVVLKRIKKICEESMQYGHKISVYKTLI